MIEDHDISSHRRTVVKPLGLSMQRVRQDEVQPYRSLASKHDVISRSGLLQTSLFVVLHFGKPGGVFVQCADVDDDHIFFIFFTMFLNQSCAGTKFRCGHHLIAQNLPRFLGLHILGLDGTIKCHGCGDDAGDFFASGEINHNV